MTMSVLDRYTLYHYTIGSRPAFLQCLQMCKYAHSSDIYRIEDGYVSLGGPCFVADEYR